ASWSSCTAVARGWRMPARAGRDSLSRSPSPARWRRRHARLRPLNPCPSDPMTQILIVEDNADLAFGLSTSLEVEGYEVAVANDGPAGLTAARDRNPDVIILDLM